MSATATEKPKASTAPVMAWMPPKPHVNQRVYWHHGQSWKEAAAENKPTAAIVTEVCGGGRVRLAILMVDSVQFIAPDDPVPHKSDPNVERFIMGDPDAGVWEEMPLGAESIGELESMVLIQGQQIEDQGKAIADLRVMLAEATKNLRPAA